MALPAPNTTWPPVAGHDRYQRIATNSTWYGGDPARLAALYGSTSGSGSTASATKRERRLLGVLHDWFWGQADDSEPDDKVHVPVAQDIATMSADLLFSSAPTFTVQPPPTFRPGDAEDPVAQAEQATMDALVERAQERLDYIVDKAGLEAVLPAAAETQAALGGVALRIGWRPGMEVPTLTRVDADAVYAEYAYGMLEALTFWRILSKDGEVVTYHLERHEVGGVYHGLYVGTHNSLGKREPLDKHPATRDLATQTDPEGWMALTPGYISAAYIPNMLPDPLDRMGMAGRSDYTPGVLTIFDSIDKAMTSWMRDLDDGRSRLLVADYMLDKREAGKGVEFDQNQHVFTPLAMNPSDKGDPPIQSVQFKIRVDEHLRTLDYLIGLAIQECGYNPDTDNGNDGAAMTATEYEGRNAKSVSTRTKKARYWVAAMGPLMEALLAFDAKFCRSGVPVLPVSMELAPAKRDSLASLASTVETLYRAKAASIQTMVAMVHPDWTQDMVDEEVERIVSGDAAPNPDAVPEYDQSVVPPGQEDDADSMLE